MPRPTLVSYFMEPIRAFQFSSDCAENNPPASVAMKKNRQSENNFLLKDAFSIRSAQTNTPINKIDDTFIAMARPIAKEPQKKKNVRSLGDVISDSEQ